MKIKMLNTKEKKRTSKPGVTMKATKKFIAAKNSTRRSRTPEGVLRTERILKKIEQ